jgi:hypothetical protein
MCVRLLVSLKCRRLLGEGLPDNTETIVSIRHVPNFGRIVQSQAHSGPLTWPPLVAGASPPSSPYTA